MSTTSALLETTQFDLFASAANLPVADELGRSAQPQWPQPETAVIQAYPALDGDADEVLKVLLEASAHSEMGRFGDGLLRIVLAPARAGEAVEVRQSPGIFVANNGTWVCELNNRGARKGRRLAWSLTRVRQVMVVARKKAPALTLEHLKAASAPFYITEEGIRRALEFFSNPVGGAKNLKRPTTAQTELLEAFWPSFKGAGLVGDGYTLEKPIMAPPSAPPEEVFRLNRHLQGFGANSTRGVSLYHNPTRGFVQLWSSIDFNGRDHTHSYVLLNKDRLLYLGGEWD